METREIYKDLITFLEKSSLEERVFKNDIDGRLDQRIIASLNNTFSLDIIKSTISCLFIKGNLKLIEHLDKLGEGGEPSKYKLYSQELKKIIDSINFNKSKLKTEIQQSIFSDIDPNEAKTIISTIKDSSNILELTNGIKDQFEKETELINGLYRESLLRNLDSILKKDFSLTQDFCDNHAEKLYELIYPAYIDCTKEQFLKFCKGENLAKPIIIKKQADFLKLLKCLNDKGLIEIKDRIWVYTSRNCMPENMNKRLNPENLKKYYSSAKTSLLDPKIIHFFK
jgi:hypothetical protein